jgi:hypothetical protein
MHTPLYHHHTTTRGEAHRPHRVTWLVTLVLPTLGGVHETRASHPDQVMRARLICGRLRSMARGSGSSMIVLAVAVGAFLLGELTPGGRND